MPATSVAGPLSRAWACRSAHSRPLGRRRMPGEPGPAPLPGVVEAWPSVAPFGEADRISVSIIALAFLCSSAGSTFASPGGNNHTWPPTAQTTGLDQVSGPGDRRPFVGARHPLRPHFARSSSAGHRWPAARDTSWLTLITSSGRHIMRRSVRQAPSAASTRPPRRTAEVCAIFIGIFVTHSKSVGSLRGGGNLQRPRLDPYSGTSGISVFE
jgi:hypothetical protein